MAMHLDSAVPSELNSDNLNLVNEGSWSRMVGHAYRLWGWPVCL